jgi:hypothetical protein
MCSYNQINNSYGAQNSYTLNYLLKNELDFQGPGMYQSLTENTPADLFQSSVIGGHNTRVLPVHLPVWVSKFWNRLQMQF